MRPKTVKGAAKFRPAVEEVQAERRIGLGAGRRHMGELAPARFRVGAAPEAAPWEGPAASAPAWRSPRPSRRGGSRRGRSPAGRCGHPPPARHVLGEAEHVGQAGGHVAQFHPCRLAPPLVDRRAAARRLGQLDLHRGRHLLPAFRGVREAEEPVGGHAAGLGDAAERLGARHAVDAGVEELAERRAVDAGRRAGRRQRRRAPRRAAACRRSRNAAAISRLSKGCASAECGYATFVVNSHENRSFTRNSHNCPERPAFA